MTKTFTLTDEEQTIIYMALDYFSELEDDLGEEVKRLWRKFRPGAL